MKCAELSLKKLKSISIDEAKKIQVKYDIDLIIYVAKAGLPIAVYMSEVLNCPILGISSMRKGNRIKSIIGTGISYCPKLIRNILIMIELKSKIHKHVSERSTFFHDYIAEINCNDVSSILLVDDSIDTGHSIVSVIKNINDNFINAQIVTYSLNVWEQSRALVEPDYYTYENTIIKTPMSKDSREYHKFCDMYDKITRNGYV